MKTLTLGIVAMMAAVGFAQDSKPSKDPRSIDSTSASPVRGDEAKKVFVRLQEVLSSALNTKWDSTTAITPDTNPVSRTKVVAEFARLRGLIQSKTKLTPKPIKYEARVLKMSDAERMKELKLLIAEGYVARVGPLAVGPQDSLTIKEFGDAVGYFLTRTAQLTHTPSRKFSPALKGDG